MDAQIEGHLPLITQRITFAPKIFPPPPEITPRMEFPAITISHRDFTPPFASDSKTGSKRGATPRRETTPRPQKTPRRDKSPRRENTPSRHCVTFEDHPDNGPLTPLTTDTEDEDVQSGKIKKPSGGSGRPGGKGYSLQTELGWNDRTYENVVSLVHKLAMERLDLTKSFWSQDNEELKKIYVKVTKAYALLQEYEDHWPIRDMLISRLKYTSESARRKEAQKKTKQMEKILTRSSGNISIE